MNISENKTCKCGHLKSEHFLQVGGVTKWAFLGEGFFRTSQIGQGLCKKCMCPKYRSTIFSSQKEDFPQRKDLLEISENRCGKCGRLLENHKDAGHDFKK